MRNRFLRLIAVSAAIAVLVASAPFSVFAENGEELVPTGPGELITSGNDSGLVDYRDYTATYKDAAFATDGDKVMISGAQGVADDESKAEAKPDFADKRGDKDVTAKDVLVWESGKGSVEYTIEIPKTGLYNFALNFLPPETGVNPEIGLSIDGKIPFDGADSIEFTRDWVNVPVEGAEKAEDDVRDTAFRSDAKGNELAPEQMQTGDFVYRVAIDDTGVAVDPYRFYLEKGTHKITLIGHSHNLVIKELGFTAPEIAPSYKDYFDQSKFTEITDPSGDLVIVIQGEDAVLKNDNSLVPKSTNGNLDMTPIDPYLTLINIIGGTTWQNPGQEITWEFEVKTPGYYQFGAHYKQSDVVNGESWRWLKIDGKTPFTEAKGVRFSYGTG